MTYPNARDCEHGRQRGKCPECDCDEADNLIAKLESDNAELKRKLDETKLVCDSAEGLVVKAMKEDVRLREIIKRAKEITPLTLKDLLKILNEANVKEDK